MLEKPLESPLDCKEIQPVHPKGDQTWMFIGRNDIESETPIFWPPDVKRWLIWKDPDAGKDWRLEEKGTPEDEMAGWHHRLDGQGFGWTLGVCDGQGGLVCCGSWGRKESDTTEQLNWMKPGATDDCFRFLPHHWYSSQCLDLCQMMLHTTQPGFLFWCHLSAFWLWLPYWIINIVATFKASPPSHVLTTQLLIFLQGGFFFLLCLTYADILGEDCLVGLFENLF